MSRLILIFVAALCGMGNLLLGTLLIFPLFAIPIVAFMTIFDEELEPKIFGISYLSAAILTGYLLK